MSVIEALVEKIKKTQLEETTHHEPKRLGRTSSRENLALRVNLHLYPSDRIFVINPWKVVVKNAWELGFEKTLRQRDRERRCLPETSESVEIFFLVRFRGRHFRINGIYAYIIINPVNERFIVYNWNFGSHVNLHNIF